MTQKGDPRRSAQIAGLKRYVDGRRCKYGHKSERLSSNGRCIECHRKAKINEGMKLKLGKAIRRDKFGYDPLDLRCRRKERGIIGVSDKKHLVALREKRKLYGRKDSILRGTREGDPWLD